MTARITKSRDPILKQLQADYTAALEASVYAVECIAWDKAVERINKARRALIAREALYTPRRERKAARKASHMKHILNRLYKGPEPRHPLSTMWFAQEMNQARGYIRSLVKGEVAPVMREDFIRETNLCLYWARQHRLQAVAFGRRLP